MEKLKMIRGSENRSEEVKRVLESWGAVDAERFLCTCEDHYYFVVDGKPDWIYIGELVLKCIDYEVVELPEPKPQPEHQFKPFDRVLVRDNDENKWRANLYSNYSDEVDPEYPFFCIYSNWKFCIPYEGNEHLVGTTDSPNQDLMR